MHQETKRRWSAKTIVFMGFFVAMNIVLTRFCSIDLGPFRLGFGPAATIMSGLWLGPLAGGVVGMVADLIGCLIDGYAINPLITVSAILWGVVPGSIGLRLAKGSTKRKTVGICASVVVAAVLSTIIFNTAGMVLFMGYSLYAILPGRLIQFAVMTPLLCVITVSLYLSPLTQILEGYLRERRARA